MNQNLSTPIPWRQPPDDRSALIAILERSLNEHIIENNLIISMRFRSAIVTSVADHFMHYCEDGITAPLHLLGRNLARAGVGSSTLLVLINSVWQAYELWGGANSQSLVWRFAAQVLTGHEEEMEKRILREPRLPYLVMPYEVPSH